MKIIVMGLTAMLLSACNSAGLALLNTGLKLGADHTINKNIQYGAEAWQTLDVHVPNTESPNKRPVLIFFYGGSWDSGHKEMYFFVANSFAKRGYVVVIPDYVKYPDATFPSFMHDGATAFDWVIRNIEQYGGNANNIVAAGHSAGAHLGALLFSDPQYLAVHNRKPQDLKGFAGLAGPYNFTPDTSTLIEVFGPPENFPNMQVNTFVDGDEPRMLLLHGESDDTVGLLNQTTLLEKLAAVGVSATGNVYPGLGHIKILMTLAPPLAGSNSTLDDMDAFFKQVTANHDSH